MKDQFDLIVFDWDGTLFDSIAWIVECLQSAAADCRLPVPSEIAAKSVIGLGLGDAMTTLFPDAPEGTAAELASHYRRYFTSRPISADDLFDGVPEMLEELRGRGYQLAIATGKTRSGLDSALRATRIMHLFHASRCADETVSKPDPTMLLQLMAERRVVSQRTLMVGDSVHDMRMAKNAGTAAVAVTCGANDETALAEFRPKACLANTTEILGLFD